MVFKNSELGMDPQIHWAWLYSILSERVNEDSTWFKVFFDGFVGKDHVERLVALLVAREFMDNNTVGL